MADHKFLAQSHQQDRKHHTDLAHHFLIEHVIASAFLLLFLGLMVFLVAPIVQGVLSRIGMLLFHSFYVLIFVIGLVLLEGHHRKKVRMHLREAHYHDSEYRKYHAKLK